MKSTQKMIALVEYRFDISTAKKVPDNLGEA